MGNTVIYLIWTCITNKYEWQNLHYSIIILSLFWRHVLKYGMQYDFKWYIDGIFFLILTASYVFYGYVK